MSYEQELTSYSTGVNAPSAHGVYGSTANENAEEKQEFLDATPSGDYADFTSKPIPSKKGLCSSSCPSYCSPFIYYISPLTCDIGHSLCCIFFHVYSFWLSLSVFIFDITALITSLVFIPLFCIGLPLLWFTQEAILILSRIDLAMSYYLVEQNSQAMPRKQKVKLKLSIYTKNIPICCGKKGDFMQRAKHLIYSLDMILIDVYHIFVKPFIVLCTSPSCLLSAWLVGMCSMPIWYIIDEDVFNDQHICPFGGYNCNGSVKHCDCYIVTINTVWKSVLFSVCALVLLPIALRLSNFCADIGKIANYYFYTHFYSEKSDRMSLLNKNENNKEKQKIKNEHTNVVQVDSNFLAL